MPFTPVVLTTDALLFLLLAAAGGYAWYARRREHLRAPWRQVARSRLGMMAAVVLCAYLLVGIADSFHLRLRIAQPDAQAAVRYSPEVLSLLDLATGHLRDAVEKTYSAPFAATLYVRETVTTPDGTVARVYPRLRHAATHLDDPERQRLGDVLATAATGALQGIALWALAVALLLYGLARSGRARWRTVLRQVARDELAVPWRLMLITAGVLIAGAFMLANLSFTYHVFGTDKVGQDVFYQTVKSIRTGLLIGTLTTLVMLPFAVLLGLVAGYFGRWVDDLIQYLYTTLNSIPGVLLIAAGILSLQVYMANHPQRFESFAESADLRLLFLCLILGVTSWTGLCRLLRGETLKLRELEYVQAATAFGVRHLGILTRHLLPNVMHVVFITVALDFSGLVLAEAVLSYVGIGVDPSMNSWGNMINQARLEMAREPVVWWSLLAAFTFMFALVLAANLLADAIRDAFDPRLRSVP